MRRYLSLFFFLAIGISLLVSAMPSWAQGSNSIVKIAPSRLVFDGRARTQVVTLINSSDQESTYRIAVVNVRMSDRGATTIAEEPTEAEEYSNKLIRYSPRQVRIPAHGSQTVRVMIRRPKDMPDGEYRSHMQFSVVPPDLTGRMIDDTAVEEGMLRIRITPLYGVTIPVIVREGNLDYSMSMSDPAVIRGSDDNDTRYLRVTLHRVGERSSYGDIIIAHIAPDGTETIIGQINHLAVYVPNPDRIVTVPLRLPEGLDLSSGRLNISYHNIQAEGGGRLASTTLDL